MLHRNVLVLHLLRQLFRGGKDLVHFLRDVDFVRFPAGAGDFWKLFDDRLQRLEQGVGIDVHLRQQLGDQPLRLGDQDAGQMRRFDLQVTVLDCQILCCLDGFQRFLRAFLHIHKESLRLSGLVLLELALFAFEC